jgi:hypothetical protein
MVNNIVKCAHRIVALALLSVITVEKIFDFNVWKIISTILIQRLKTIAFNGN